MRYQSTAQRRQNDWNTELRRKVVRLEKENEQLRKEIQELKKK